ncbi:MFS multidrug transporter-like protein [Glonium stellatum]|uniref:MFS multidrug transporter-like protein n=1 Tax=Glonium stellatum TaxID=574774 RepID=A0A8E2JTF3_9PEZI|nr:MFS multidrug transporter-like protein [Glonium stellatum]
MENSSASTELEKHPRLEAIAPVKDWSGPSDKENPYNWTKAKKIYHTAVPAAFAFVVTTASSIYIPGRELIRQQFHVSLTVALLPYSFYVFGQAWGPVLAAPLSETFGRRGTYIPYLSLFALFTLGAGFSQSITAITVCRFFAGVFGSPVLSVSAGTIADIWMPQDRAIPMAVLVLIPFLGPSFGPLISGYTVPAKGWRWTQWIILFITVAASIFAGGMKETYKKVLLSRRAKQLGAPGPDGIQLSLSQKLNLLLTSTLFRPWNMFFTEIIVGTFAFYIGFNFAIYYSLFAAMPYIFAKVYSFNLGLQGLVFLGLAVGNVLAFTLVLTLSQITYRRTMRAIKTGKAVKPPPEKRLLLALIGSVFVPTGLFWCGWSARSSVHWIVPIAGSAVFAFGNFLVFMSYAIYVIDVYGAGVGASATATVAMVRSLLGAAFPLFTIQMYERLGISWATSLLAFFVLALTPVPWILYRFGPAIRARSRYIS